MRYDDLLEEVSDPETMRLRSLSLRAIAQDITWEDVPGTDVYSCGNYRDHSLLSRE